MRRTRASWASRGVAIAVAILFVCPATASAAPSSVTALSTPATPEALLPVDVTPQNPAPVLVVRSYRTSPKSVLVGSGFTLSLDVFNATSRRAENVVVSVGSGPGSIDAAAQTGSGGLIVLGTGNAKYIGTLKGSKSASVSFEMMAGPGTTPGTYAIPVTVAFEYEKQRLDVSYTVGVIIEREPAFAVVTAELPASAVVGEAFDASFEVANTGGFAVSGVTLSVEASTAVVSEGSIYLGTFDPAGSEAIDVSITPKEPGTLDVVLTVRYRDDFGRARSFNAPYRVQVKASQQPDEGTSGATPDKDAPKEGPTGLLGLIMAFLGLGT
ncbi:MAG: hypothetical protein LLG24_03950 [Actinomycetia bacterium]|nr:hypothetical protein [Actinomycetes bacterium]